jgi:hypothetical protein
MLSADSLGGWFQGASTALLMSLASILFAVMVALIPFLARRIVTGEIGAPCWRSSTPSTRLWGR